MIFMETHENKFEDTARPLIGTLLLIQAVITFMVAGILSILTLLLGPIAFSQITKDWWAMTILFAIGPYVVSVLMGIAAVLISRRKKPILIFIFLSLYIILYLGFVHTLLIGDWTRLAIVALLPVLPPIAGVITALRFKNNINTNFS
jgi:hypothetical protein